jgi:hypothetical protein
MHLISQVKKSIFEMQKKREIQLTREAPLFICLHNDSAATLVYEKR